MRYSKRLLLALALAPSFAFAQAPQVNDVQLRPGSSALWGAAYNVNNNQDISQYNTAGSVVDSFRWFQGASPSSALQLWAVGPTGALVGTPTGSRQGAGTLNAQGLFVNGVAVSTSSGGTPGGSSGQIQFNDAGAFGGFTTSGDATINTASGALTLATVNAGVGSFGSATACTAFTTNAKGLITAASATTCTPAIASITGLGTGIATALAINIGSAGAPVLFNGAGGTPSSLVGTNITGIAAGLTAGTASAVAVGGITGLGANVATALAVNVGSAGAFTTFNGALGTPSSGGITNLTGTCTACTANAFTAGSAANLTSGTLPAARTNGHMNGTATNDNAAAGEVGEYVELNVASGSAVSLTTGTPANIGAGISLTAGDWDVTANVTYVPAATTNFTLSIHSISNTSATQDTTTGNAYNIYRFPAGNVPVAGFNTASVGPVRKSLSGTTTIFLVAQASFTVSTMSAYGIIRARRVR